MITADSDRPRSATVSRETHDRRILRARNSDSWFQFYREYYRIMPRLTSLFFQDLWNLADAKTTIKENVDDKPFFLCTESFLSESESRWTEKEQRYHINILIELGFLKKIRRGIPSRRWLYIDVSAVEDALDAAENRENPNDSQSGQKGRNCSRQKGPERTCQKGRIKENTSYSPEKTKSRPATPGRHPSEQSPLPEVQPIPTKSNSGFAAGVPVPANRIKGMFCDSPMPVYADNGFPGYCYEFADRLHRLAERTLDKQVKFSKKAWAASFQEIVGRCNGNHSRVRRIIELAEKHCGESGWPKKVQHPKHFEGLFGWFEEESEKITGEPAKVRKLIYERIGTSKNGNPITRPRFVDE